ncbi:hypothetical protein AKJ16_DCAP27382 [Drosera capensis]
MNRTFSRRRNVKENLCSYPPTWLVSSTYAAAAADFSPSIQPPHPPSISLNRRLPLTLLCLHGSENTAELVGCRFPGSILYAYWKNLSGTNHRDKRHTRPHKASVMWLKRSRV